MDALNAILTRRSIRRYKPEPVPDALIDDALRAAMSAPSAGNEQPWHFIVITERSILDTIPSFHPHSLMLREAPIAVLVCSDLQLEKHTGYWVQDCAAATQNFLLAAHARGLGAVWLGIFPREERVSGLRKLLGIPEHVVPFSLIPVGFPAEVKPPADRFSKDRIHYNTW